MLTTEKTFAAQSETIDKIAIDVRQYIAYEAELLQNATPNYQDISVNYTDLQNTATPSQ